ncbi:MAG: hypothetical protein L6R40_003028 [Gallowayella cf. fulva]|nr:MAG: hypothetical protein L6R40_003028 [Xanthomendoza cf. fulva]
MASALTASPYPGHSPVFRRVPQHPPSPPIEEFHSKCTLPSIQTLIGTMTANPFPDEAQQLKPERESSLPPRPTQQQSLLQTTDTRPQAYGQPPVSNPRALPPTPPFRPNPDFDDSQQSPSATSSRSSAAPSGPYYGSMPNNTAIDPQLKREVPPPASQSGLASLPSASESPYGNSPYPPSPTNATTYSYPPPGQVAAAPPQMYYQHPLPTNFPPPPPPPAPVPMDPALSNSPQQQSPDDQPSPWQHQHHHYISPSSSAAFSGQPQDRYVCQTCSKAFSRPSSLRIHSHSHTGEKPFKCPHPGCGKAFSVRSNMKRHERGCHGGSSPGEV